MFGQKFNSTFGCSRVFSFVFGGIKGRGMQGLNSHLYPNICSFTYMLVVYV